MTKSTRPTPPPKDWPAVAERLAKGFDPTRRQELADRLRLPVEVFDVFPLIGVECATTEGTTFAFPECNSAGTIIGVNRWFSKPGADGKNKLMPGGRRGLTQPCQWRDRPGPVYVVVGPTDTLAMTAAGLACIGRPVSAGDVAMLAELFHDWPADRSIVVVGQRDRSSDGAEPVATALARQLRRPVQWALPPDPAKDTRDWLTAADRREASWSVRGSELAAALLAGAQIIEPSPSEPTDCSPSEGQCDGPPVIVVGTDEHRVNAEASAALAAEADVYQRGGLLVHVLEQAEESDPAAVVRRPLGTLTVRPLARTLLRERLTHCATWKQWKGAGDNALLAAAHPPDWCVGAVYDRGQWPGVHRLTAVVPHPVILPDGSILSASGYHAATGLLACIPPGLIVSVPDHPTRADVDAAIAVLLDPMQDFPFETAAHRAAWVAGLLTPLAWYAFDGPAPLFLTDANVRAAGKGLSVDVIALILTGRRFPVMAYTPDREELRKRITTLAVEGERAVLLDNLAGPVGNDVLDAALTADTWRDRILGTNKVYDGPLHVVWYATGNNVELQADTSRRACHIRMESPDERPETKANFMYPNLREHVRANRSRLLSAALSILKGWTVAGRPKHGLPSWGSYESWSHVVREAVVFAGLPDPGETRIALQTAADRDAAAMTAVIAAMQRLDSDRRGLTTAGIIDVCRKSNSEVAELQSDLRSAVEDLCGRLDGQKLGYRLRQFKRRNFGGLMVDRAGETGGATRWVVLPVGRRRGPDFPPEPPPASPT